VKVLLMTPPLPDPDWMYGGFRGSTLWEVSDPPLGLAYIAAVLEKAGHEVKIFDCAVEKMQIDDFKLPGNDFDLIGITCVTMNYPQVKELVNRIKGQGDFKTIIGGPHPTSIPMESFRYCNSDYLAVGEGENTMLELADTLEKGKSVKDVKGILFREGDKIVGTEPRPLIENLDELPFPARHLLDLKKYKPEIEKNIKQPATNMITSRGCPYRCIFCCRNIFGNAFRAHSAQYVLNEIKFLQDKHSIKDIIFFDDTFSVDNQRVIDICDGIIKDKMDIIWNCSARVNTVTRDLIFKMAEAGCYQIAFGVESGSQRVLNLIKKGIIKEQVERAVKWTKEADMEARCYFMLGIPGETIEEMRETVNFAKKLNPDVVHFSIATPFPATEMSDIASKLTKGTWDDYCAGRNTDITNINLSTMTREQLNEFTSMAYKEFYLRPSFMLSRVSRLRNYWYFKRYMEAFKAIVKRYVI